MSTCRTCGKPIVWKRLGVKWIAMDSGGVVHWANCKPKRKLEIGPARHIVGANYRPACGKCQVPPWESCACSVGLAATVERPEADVRKPYMGSTLRINKEADERMRFALGSE